MSFAAAAAAMAWGSAHGWDAYAFRVYYLAGALLSAPLLGIGSLQLMRRRWAAPVGLLWVGVAIGLALALRVHGTFGGSDVPRAQDHLDVLAARARDRGAARSAPPPSSVVAALTLRRRPLGNVLLLAAVGAAAAASALTQTAVAAAAACFALAAALLYAGASRRWR